MKPDPELAAEIDKMAGVLLDVRLQLPEAIAELEPGSDAERAMLRQAWRNAGAALEARRRYLETGDREDARRFGALYRASWGLVTQFVMQFALGDLSRPGEKVH